MAVVFSTSCIGGGAVDVDAATCTCTSDPSGVVDPATVGARVDEPVVAIEL